MEVIRRFSVEVAVDDCINEQGVERVHDILYVNEDKVQRILDDAADHIAGLLDRGLGERNHETRLYDYITVDGRL